jgi:phenylacetate-coenzyme A ligase PaaK-like adenylate-forming protein
MRYRSWWSWSKGGFTGELKDLGEVKCSVEDKLKAVLNLKIVVELVEKEAIPKTAGEAGRVVEMRGKN